MNKLKRFKHIDKSFMYIDNSDESDYNIDAIIKSGDGNNVKIIMSSVQSYRKTIVLRLSTRINTYIEKIEELMCVQKIDDVVGKKIKYSEKNRYISDGGKILYVDHCKMYEIVAPSIIRID